MRTPIIETSERNSIPVWFLLPDKIQRAIRDWQKENYDKIYRAPRENPPVIAPFDAAQEMTEMPRPSREAMK